VRLESIDASTIRLAVKLYLSLAYPGDHGPKAPVPEFSGEGTARDLIPDFSDESEERDGRTVGRYVLRLGNEKYPHMKLVLEENILRHEYAFGVDTHDDLRISPDNPDYERFNAVRAHNADLATRIEQSWQAAGIPTLKDIQELFGSDVEQLCPPEQQSLLIVDDEPSIRDALSALFTRAGMEVRTAENGRVALERVAEDPPDLILMDYQMPELDGVATCEQLKSDKKTRRIPVLLATASQVDLAALTYADGFLVKPYRQDILFQLVKKLLA
jgi:CheY-like chemotaxis protein